MFAVFETGGKQYKVSEGDVVKIERLAVKDGETVTFTKVLAVGGETLSVGAPYVDGASVVAEVLEADKKDVRELFRELQSEYEQEGRGIRIREADDAFGYVTHIENDIFVRKLCTPVRVKRLSQAALEVLAIIAYRQPVTRSEIDSIRGIKSERVIDGLIDKGLVEISGRSEGIGRPLIYVTTREFLKKFGFASLKDLPEVPEYEELRRTPEEEAGYGQMMIDFEGQEESNEN